MPEIYHFDLTVVQRKVNGFLKDADVKKIKNFMINKFKKTTKPSGLKRVFVCGTVASLIGSGCQEDLEPLSEKNLKTVQEIVDDGHESFFPVLEEIAETVEENNTFGFNSRGGYGTFRESFLKTKNRLDQILLNREIYSFKNKNNTAGAFYFDYDQSIEREGFLDKSDYIAVNLSRQSFAAVDEGLFLADGSWRISYGLLMHEASHEWSKHSETADDFISRDDAAEATRDEMCQKLLVEERDFSYLISLSLDQLNEFRDRYYLNGMEYLELEEQFKVAKKQLEIYSSDENYNEYEKEFKEKWAEKLFLISTPEGWSEMVLAYGSGEEISYVRDYWGLSLEDQRKIISESGWYEDYLEDDITAFVNEVRIELGLQYDEARSEIMPEASFKNKLSQQEDYELGRPRIL